MTPTEPVSASDSSPGAAARQAPGHTLDPATFAEAAGHAVLWSLLTHHAGCCVAIAERDGATLFANRGSRAWLEWRLARGFASAEDNGNPLARSCSPEMAAERRGFLQRVCDEGVTIAYESINNGVRELITLSPIPAPHHGGRVVLSVSRRLRPWERVTRELVPGAVIVKPETQDPGPLALLSPRELEVLILVGEGHSYAEIGKMLHRSRRTIERHRDGICNKLGLTTRVEIARYAIRAGLAELSDPADDAMLSQADYDPLAPSETIRTIAHRRAKRRTSA